MMRIFIFLLILLCGCGYSKKNSFRNSCSIKDVVSGQTVGSGVLLDDGFVLTAAHVVDRNDDFVCTSNEKIVELEFGSGEKTNGVVVYAGNHSAPFDDYAVIKPLESLKINGVKLVDYQAEVGEDLYTVGSPDGRPLHISSGLESNDSFYGRTASIPVFFGNSGGPVFNSHGDVIGIVTRVGGTYNDITFMSHSGLEVIRMPMMISHYCIYVPTHLLYQAHTENVDLTSCYYALAAAIIFGAFVILERKNILG